MSSMTLISALQKLRSSVNGRAIIARRSPWGSTRAMGTGPPPPHDDFSEPMIDQLANKFHEARLKANKTLHQAGKTTESVGEKAKQVAEDAWESTKEAAEKVKDGVAGKTEETKETIKENAETIKSAMNTKNIR